VVTNATALDLDLARSVAAAVVDPEIPVLTVEELGILRQIEVVGERLVVAITPTYSGCPAMRQIEDDIHSVLGAAGFEQVEVVTVHHPVWSSSWITAAGREKLARFGIAPPLAGGEILCPRCRSADAEQVARFVSTACKALMVCTACAEPFDYFKVF
jgi:ring-1,2-phenylacetyl-CoA epoxidase subunit PaaD